MREDEGDDEEEVSSQAVPVPLTCQQPAEHLQALLDCGLITNLLQITASIRLTKELFDTEQCRKASCFKQRTIDAVVHCLKGST